MYKVFVMKEILTAQECLRLCVWACVYVCEEGAHEPFSAPLNTTTCCIELKELERAACDLFNLPTLAGPGTPVSSSPLIEETRGLNQESINVD